MDFEDGASEIGHIEQVGRDTWIYQGGMWPFLRLRA
jgi:hypothetical protein